MYQYVLWNLVGISGFLLTNEPSFVSWHTHTHALFTDKLVCSYIAAAAKLLQLCPTLCNPIDGSPPGSSVHGILQARELEWGAIAFSGSYIDQRVK